MTIQTVNLQNLKRVKNSVIGNPQAKLQLAQDQHYVETLVECLNRPPPQDPQGSEDDIRIEAAHVISSLSYGSEEALTTLLRSNAPQAFLYAISKFRPSDSTALRAAFARALRALAVSMADVVGPSLWGLRADTSIIRSEAKEALDFLFHPDSMDIYLPLLIDTSTQTSTSIAQLLASAVRTPHHRKTVTEWLPLPDRMKEVKTRRGWEKTAAASASAPGRGGGWVARNLAGLLKSRDAKLQEAALLALAAMAQENPSVAIVLAKPSIDREIPAVLTSVLSLSKSRSTDVQLAACLCATRILRASASSHPLPTEDTAARTIMNIVNRMISNPSTESPQTRTKACFILYHLVTDDAALCHAAFDRGCLEKLATLIQSITPAKSDTESDEDEAESVSCLREASLTAIAAISLFDNDIRRTLTDDLHLLPSIRLSLSHPHAGVRYGACQCVRALSRAVAVLRTNLEDSEIGMEVFAVFRKEGEDRRVTGAALAAVCNIVNEFSPLRPKFLEHGLMPRLVQLLHSGDSALRLSSLWAVKNLLRKTSEATKSEVMGHLGWEYLVELLEDTDEGVQEQAFNVLRNLAENEAGIAMVFRELGTEVLLNRLAVALASSEENVVLQAAYVLANLANGHLTHQDAILSHPRVLSSVRLCLAESSKAEIRRPAVACVLELARANPGRRKEMTEAGIGEALRGVCEWGAGGVVVGSPGGRTLSAGGTAGGISPGGARGVEDDKDVIEEARMVLGWLESEDS